MGKPGRCVHVQSHVAGLLVSMWDSHVAEQDCAGKKMEIWKQPPFSSDTQTFILWHPSSNLQMWTSMPAELMQDGNLVQMAHYDHYLVVYETPVSEREEYRQLAESLCNYCFVPSPQLCCEADCVWSFTGMRWAQGVCERCEKPLLPANLKLPLNFAFFTLCSGLLLIAIHESFISAYSSYQMPQEHEKFPL